MEIELSKLGIQQVTLFSDPSGAKITIDGADQGATPWTGELAPGQHTAKLQQPGFTDMQVKFLVESACRRLDLAATADLDRHSNCTCA